MSNSAAGEDQVFVDGVGRIMISGMTIRIELTTVDPSTADASGKSRAIVRERLVMPIDGFVRTVQQLNRTLARLESMGVIRKGEPQQTTQEVIGAPDETEGSEEKAGSSNGGDKKKKT